MDIKRSDRITLNILLFLTFDLMLLGAGVRTMNAGLTCPDWPLCFGKVIPEFHFGVYLEFTHRVIAGLVAILYAKFFVSALKDPALRSVKILSYIGLFFLIAQILMGGLTVLKLLEAYIVTLHLTLGTAFLLCLYFIKLETTQQKAVALNPARSSRIFKSILNLSILFVFIQIVVGGMVASTYSGLVCIDFPTCNGQFFPRMVGPIAIQMWHRFGAYWLAFLMTSLFVLAVFYAQRMGLMQKQRVQAVQIFMLVLTQIFIGVMNLKYLMPAMLSVLHLGIALSILLYLATLRNTVKN